MAFRVNISYTCTRVLTFEHCSGAQADQEDAPGALHRGEEQVVLQQAPLLSVAWTREVLE
jgi:hypothetical protein